MTDESFQHFVETACTVLMPDRLLRVRLNLSATQSAERAATGSSQKEQLSSKPRGSCPGIRMVFSLFRVLNRINFPGAAA